MRDTLSSEDVASGFNGPNQSVCKCNLARWKFRRMAGFKTAWIVCNRSLSIPPDARVWFLDRGNKGTVCVPNDVENSVDKSLSKTGR